MCQRMYGVCWVFLVAITTCSTIFAQVPEPPPTPTLWNFLGIPQAVNKLHAHTFNRRGNHPNLEKKPPLLKIADPKNLESDVPAIKAAAEVKQAEDLAPQKVKAIKYLAQIGCGCYDKDQKITKALLAAMEDCTEDVRLAAVRAISMAASGERCVNCKQQSCCNEMITEQLAKIAYELDDLGCPLEPSERVREAAIEALGICCPGRVPVSTAPPLVEPVEGVDQPAPVEGVYPSIAPPPPPAPPVPSAASRSPGLVDPNNFLREAALQGSTLRNSLLVPPLPPSLNVETSVLSAPAAATAPVAASVAASAPVAAPAANASARRTQKSQSPSAGLPTPAVVPEVAPLDRHQVDPPEASPANPASSRRTARLNSASYQNDSSAAASPGQPSGTVALVNPQRNLAHVHLTASRQSLPIGAKLRVYYPDASGRRMAGEVEVVNSLPGSATVRGIGSLNLADLPPGTIVD